MGCYNDYIVNIDVLKQNALNIKNRIGLNKKFCAVVKANAYGVGLYTVCKALYGIADFFACACLKEAMSIRVFDKSTKILILSPIDAKQLELIVNNNISISVGTLEQLTEINSVVSRKVNIHLQINTGLNRFGFRNITDFTKALKIISKNDNLNLEGVYSHFATKQNDIEFMNRQYLRFLQFKKYISDKNIIFHLANSYGTIKSDKYHFDMVRNGFLLYGFTSNDINNKPVINIHSKVINILNAKKGDTIGYDRTYKVTKNTQIAVIPVGYADGLSRKLSNNFKVIINNKKYPIVGMICMDVFMVDIGKDNVKIGDKVILLGKSKNEKISLTDYSNNLNTSPYEILCNFNYKRMNYIIKTNKNT